MRAFAERGYDLIIGVGFAQTPIMEAVAKDYPDIQFAIVDGVSESAERRLAGLQGARRLVSRRHDRRPHVEDRHDRLSSAAWTSA